MTRIDVAVLAIRLLALFVWYEALGLLFSLAYVLARIEAWDPSSEQVLSLLLGMLLLAGFGCALYLLAPAIARRMFPGSEPLDTMSGTEVGLLAFKICGLLVLRLFIGDIGRLPEHLKHSSPAYPRDLQDFYLLMTALRGVLAAVLVAGAPFLSRRLFRLSTAAPEGSLLQRVQPVAFSVVGLYFAFTSLVPVVQELIRAQYFGELWFNSVTWAHLVIGVLGLVLFVGGSSLARFWRWLHHAGLKPRTAGADSGARTD